MSSSTDLGFGGKALARLASVCILMSFCSGMVLAVELGISPLRVRLAPGHNAGSVTLVNHGDGTIAMQVEAFEWGQEDGGLDWYSTTPAVLAVPPIFELAPGDTQLIRVGLLTPRDASDEAAYRLVLTELKPPAASADNPGLRMRTRVSIPIFVAPEAALRQMLGLEEFVVVNGMARIRLHNHGNTHVRLERLQLVGDGERETPSVKDLATYLLPGVSREFLLRMPDDGRVGRVRVRTSAAERIEFLTPNYPTRVTDAPMASDLQPAVDEPM